MAKSIRFAVATAATLVSAGAPQVSASQIQDAYYAHTRSCIKLFLTDEAAHAAQCLPNTMPSIPANAGSGGPTPVVVAPPPPPAVLPPPDVDSSYPEVDSSYPQA